jgi:hypothetical protein
MKIADSSKWAPRNKLNLPMPFDEFYYRLVSVLYNILNEDGYFDEDN